MKNLATIPTSKYTQEMAKDTQPSTSQKIILAAADLFYRETFSDVTVDAIARQAGITKMTVYQHFRSKETILLECLRFRLDRRESTLNAWLDGAQPSVAVLLGLFDWLEASIKKGEFRGCAFLKSVNELSETLPEVRKIAQEAKTLLRKRVISVARAAGMAEPTIIGEEIAVLLEGAQALAAVEQSIRPLTVARRAGAKLISYTSLP